MKHFVYIIIASACCLWSCSNTADIKPEPVDPVTPDDITTEVTITPSGSFYGSAGVFLFDSRSGLMNSAPIQAECIGDGKYKCSVKHSPDIVVSSVVCVSPYQASGLSGEKTARARLFPCQVQGDGSLNVSAGSSELSLDGTASVVFSELSRKVTVQKTTVTDIAKPYLLLLDFGKPEAGVLTLGKSCEKVFHTRFGSSVIALPFDGGLDGSEISWTVFGEDASPAVKLAVTPDKIIENGKSYDAKTFCFLDGQGNPAAQITKDKISLNASDGSGSFSFSVSNAEMRAGEGLVLKCDYVTPGSITIPTIDEKQISRIICVLDKSSDVAPHTLWLDVFDGEVWSKVPGMEYMSNPEHASANAGILDFKLPKKSISAAGVFRIACGVGEETTVIRSVTVLYENESCSHDPRSLVSDDYASKDWGMAGTNTVNDADNHFYREKCMIKDMDVSHVDDGSGSLRLGGLECINNYKPWIGWRYKDIPVNAGDVLRIYFCLKTENMPTTANLYLSIGFKNSSNVWIDGWIPGAPTATSMNGTTSLWVDKVKGTHDWTKFTADVTVPEGAVKLSYFTFMLQSVIYAPTAWAWFDDINVVKIN